MPSPPGNLPIVDFASQTAWADWLKENHARSSGVWLRVAKKGSGVPSVSYDEAIEAALCFGWSEGQKGKYDEPTWVKTMQPSGRRRCGPTTHRKRGYAL